MAYTRTTWVDSPSTSTPLDQSRLNNAEAGIVGATADAATALGVAIAGQTYADAKALVGVVTGTSFTALVRYKNKSDAMGGIRTATLPSAAGIAGSRLVVEKSDASTNVVNVTGSIRGVTATIVLSLFNESVELLSDGATWEPVGDARPLPSLDSHYGLPANAPAGLKYAYDARRNVYNWKTANTRRHRAGLAKAATGAITNEVVIGDSLSAGCVNNTGPIYDRPNAWPMVYRNTLTTLGVPAGGSGLIRILDATAIDSRWTFTGTWGGVTTYSYSVTAGSTATLTADRAGTGVTVAYFSSSSTGAFNISVDGAVSGAGFLTVPAGGSAGWTLAQLPAATIAVGQSIVITTSTATLVIVAGAAITAASGLVVNNVAQSGSTAAGTGLGAWGDLTTGGVNNQPIGVYSPAGMYTTPPTTVHVALGTNDMQVPYTAAAIMTAITAIRNAFGTSDCILYLLPQPGVVAAATWATLVATMYQLADALDCPLVDLQDRFGGYTIEAANGLTGDTLAHLTKAAYFDWGRNIAQIAAG